MKIYIHEKGIILTGKACEIRRKLKEYQKEFPLILDWINFVQQDTKLD